MNTGNKKRIAVFASGRGSNFKSIVAAIESGSLQAEIVALICDKEDAPVLSFAKEKGVPAFFVSLPKIPDKELQRRDHEKKIMEILTPLHAQFIVLAGYTRILSPLFLAHFKSEKGYYKVINIHPSLLPSFSGLQGYAKAFAYGCKRAGFTVHFVDEKCDQGPICDQVSFSISECISTEEVEKKGLELENKHFPEILSWILQENFEIEQRVFDHQRRTCVRTC
jgi:phosphoribosylglycinamide formyltransferase-1